MTELVDIMRENGWELAGARVVSGGTVMAELARATGESAEEFSRAIVEAMSKIGADDD